MINLCKKLRIRQKQYKKYFYCCESKTITYIDNCKKCLKFEPRVNKPIKKVSKKRIFVKEEVYDEVYNRDKGKCRLKDINCNGGLELHHIVYRSEDKSLINEPTNCIMLCNKHHKLVHKNKHYWQPILKEIIQNERQKR